jgi:hypothetical protein
VSACCSHANFNTHVRAYGSRRALRPAQPMVYSSSR